MMLAGKSTNFNGPTLSKQMPSEQVSANQRLTEPVTPPKHQIFPRSMAVSVEPSPGGMDLVCVAYFNAYIPQSTDEVRSTTMLRHNLHKIFTIAHPKAL
jgi:hypothetical protein